MLVGYLRSVPGRTAWPTIPSFDNVPSVSSDNFSVSTSVPNKAVWDGNFIRSVCLARHWVASYLATFTLRLVGGFG